VLHGSYQYFSSSELRSGKVEVEIIEKYSFKPLNHAEVSVQNEWNDSPYMLMLHSSIQPHCSAELVRQRGGGSMIAE
jgi:hypothetical protein